MAKRKIEVVIAGDNKSLQRAVGSSVGTLGKLNTGFAGAAKSAIKFAAVTAGVVGVGAAIKGVGEQTIGFDKSMRNVNSIAQLNEKQFGKLEKSVLKLAGKTAQAPKTLADGLYDLVSSGFDARDSLKILESAAKAATAGLTTTETSTAAVAAVLNAYHRPASDAANISDVLFQTVNRGVINFETLASVIGDVLPFAASLGVNLNQVGAALSTMTKEGLSGEEASTRLKNTLVDFIKPSKDMAAAIKKTGYESGEALIKSKGFQGALEAVIGTTDKSKVSVAKLFPNIRGLGGALALTGKNAKSAHDDLAAFKDVTGATDKALSQQSKSVAFQWNKLKATISAVAITVGSVVIPALTKGLTAVIGFANKAGSAIKGVIHTFQDLRGGGASVGGALATMFTNAFQKIPWDSIGATIGQGMSKAFSASGKLPALIQQGLSQSFAAVNGKAVLGKLVDVIGQALTELFNPAFWIKHFAAIFSIVTFVIPVGKILKLPGFGLLYNFISKPFLAALKAAGTAFGRLAGQLFKGAINNALIEISKVAPRFAAVMFHLVNGGVKEIGKLPGLLLRPVRAAGNAIVKAMEGTASAVGGAVGRLVSLAIQIIGKLVAPYRVAARAAISALISGFRAGAGAVAKTMANVGTRAVAAIRGVIGQFVQIGKEITAAILRGMGDLAGAIAGKVKGALGGAAGLAKKGIKAIIDSAGPQPLFTLEHQLAGLQGSREALQGSFDSADIASRRAAAQRGLKSKDKNTVKQAKQDLAALNEELRRNKLLSAIDFKIKGKEDLIKFKAALKGIRGQLHDLAAQAGDKFRDKLLKGIADSSEAKELADLQKQDKAEQDARTEQDLNKALEDAKASDDKDAVARAEEDIAAFKRQKREEELQATIDANTASVDDQVQQYQDGLDAQLQALADHLTGPGGALDQYKDFANQVAQVLANTGLGGLTFEASSDDEQAVIGEDTGTPGRKKTVRKKRKKVRGKRAMGGPVSAGAAYIVGEHGQEVFVPNQSGQIVPNNRLGGAYVHVDKMEVRNTTDVQRWASRLAFKLKTA